MFTRVPLDPGVHDFAFTCPNCGDTSILKVNIAPSGAAISPRRMVHAFGDESSFGGVIAYGIVAVHAHNRHAAERLLAGLKRRYGVDPHEEFHCKELFHRDARQKTGWKHLSVSQILDFAEELLSGLMTVPTVFTIGAAHRSEQPNELPEAGHFPAVPMGTKQLAAVMSQAALLPLNQVYDQSEIKFWTDPDRSKISFGYGRVQAHRMHYLNDSDANQHIAAESFDEQNKPPLLQVADLFAYTATHALTEKKNTFQDRFERFYKTCNPNRAFMGFHNDEDAEFEPIPSRLVL